LVSNVRSCDRALANSNKAIEIDPICEGRFAAPRESANGKVFGRLHDDLSACADGLADQYSAAEAGKSASAVGQIG